jgi:uncharacterized protein YndB with AHSA1/START domain
MTVHVDETVPSRSIALEVEVPGTPEQVWQAIATGPGFTAWFCPATVEERLGGTVSFTVAPGWESKGEVSTWEPPHRFAVFERHWAPGAPACFTEITVEALAGGTCKVRLVNSLFTSQADWDDQLESLEKGWPAFLNVLALYLTHFPGQPTASVQALGSSTKGEATAWAELAGALGLTGARVGERRSTAGLDAPPLAGVVERAGEVDVLLRLDQPHPGVAYLAGCTHGGQVLLALAMMLYGEGGTPIAARESARWQAWLSERFPMPAAPETVDASG